MSFKQKIRKIPGRFKFLLLVSILYGVIFFFNKSVAIAGFNKTFAMLIKIVPLLVFVFVVMIAVSLYVDSGKIKKHLGAESGVKGWIYSIVIGILISGPPYVLFPMLKELKEHGMKNSLLAVFLYNRNVKISFLPVMVYYFGLKFTIVTSIVIVIFSILNGVLVEFFVRDKVVN